MSDAPDDRWVTVAEFGSPMDAQLARMRLDAAGIEARVLEGALSSVYPLTTGAIGLVRVTVPRQAAEEALAVLAEPLAEDTEQVGEDEPADEPVDPGAGARGSPDAGDDAMRRAMGAAVFSLFLFPPLAFYAVYVLVARGTEPVTAKGRRWRVIAIAFVALTAGFWAYLAVQVLRTQPA